MERDSLGTVSYELIDVQYFQGDFTAKLTL